MQSHATYFSRNEGAWNWTAHFEIVSWQRFLRSDLSLLAKIQVAGLVLSQKFFGDYPMQTILQFHPGSSAEVHHKTRLYRFGLDLLRSEKTFSLDPNGSGMTIEGSESYWPFHFIRNRFSGLKGQVKSSTTEAEYQMPMLGLVAKCRTRLDGNRGEILLETNWLNVKFELIEESKKILAQRFQR